MRPVLRSPSFLLPLLLLAFAAGGAGAANIRFIAVSSSMGPGDVAMRNLMQSFGHSVTVKSAHTSTAADTAGQDLLVISSSAGTVETGTKFRDVAKPVIVLKYALLDEMGMVSTAAGQAGGFPGAQTTLLAPAHPLAAGLSGTVTVFSPDDNLNWGVPATGALRIASLPGDPNRVSLFAYETGAAMVGMSAPARRISFFYRDNGAVRTTAQGQALFRAAIDWSLGMDGPPPAAPVITAQPQGAVTNEGLSADFSVAATGVPAPTYQWLQNGVEIPGATAAGYTTPPTSRQDDNSVYSVVVSNGQGMVTSGDVVLRVRYSPAFLAHPAGQVLAAGQSATFTATVEGNPAPTLQWLKDGADIDGARGSSYTTPPLEFHDDSAVYQVRAINNQGTVVSEAGIVRVTSAPVLSGFPDTVQSLEGQTATFNPRAFGYPTPTFQWRKNGVAIPGATALTYTTPPATAADHGAVYSLVATNSLGSVEGTPGLLMVYHPPIITSQAGGRTAHNGGFATFGVSASGFPAPTYQWTRNGTPIPGAAANILTLGPVTRFDDSAQFRVVVSNAYGTVTSEPALLRVLYPPVILSQPGSFSVYPGKWLTLEVVAVGNPAPTYQWRSLAGSIPGETKSTHMVNANLPPDFSIWRTVAVTNSEGTVHSETSEIKILELPTIAVSPPAATVQSGQSITFSVDATPYPGAAFQWLRDSIPIPGATGPSYSLPDVTPDQHGRRFSVAVTHPDFTVTSTASLLTVQAAPIVTGQPGNASVAAGQTATFHVAASGNPVPAFQWYRNGLPIPGATGAAYTTPSTAPADDSTLFTVTATNEVGSATSAAALLRVLYTPVISDQPLDLTVEEGEVATLSVSARGNPGVTYQWQRNGANIPGATSRTYARTTDYLDDSTFYRVAVTNAAGTVFSRPVLLRVHFAPVVLTLPGPLQHAYSGDSVGYEIRVLANPPPTYTLNYTVGADPTVSPPNPDGQKTLFVRLAVPLGPTGSSHSLWFNVSNSMGSRSVNLQALCSGFRTGPPVFWRLPSDTQVAAGAKVTLQAGAGGNPLPSLQWRRNGVDVPGATSNSLILDPAGPDDDGAAFSVVAANGHGSVASPPAILSVLHAPVIDTTPAPATVVAGGSHTFRVSARGNPAPSYQWRRNGVDIPGATGSSYTVSSAGAELDGSGYAVSVSNGLGSLTSQPATLAVLHPPVILSGPQSAAVLAGQTHTFTVEVRANPAASFQWRKNGADIAGATSSAYTTPPAVLSDDGASYAVTVSNSQGGAASAPAVLHVQPVLVPPSIVSQPQDLFLYPGDTAVFRVAVAGDPAPTVTWTIMGGTFEPGPHPGDSLWLEAVEAGDDGLRVRAEVRNPAGAVSSREAFLRVSPRPTRHLVSLTGELFDAQNLSPMGYDFPVGADVTVRLFAQAVGGTAVYTEEFLGSEGRSVLVDRGLFTVRLGQGRTSQALSEVVANHGNLYGELTVQVAGLARETLQPRTPITSPLLAGTPRILTGTADPTASEPVGTYYENTADGSTWLRMPSAWIRIAP